MDRMGHSSMRAALIYLHANRGASKAIAAGIDRQLAEAGQKHAAKPAENDDRSGTAVPLVVRRLAGESPGWAPDQGRGAWSG
jgi:hypothetical protein